MSLGAPQWFWGLLAIPFLVALFLTAEKRGEKRLHEFVSARLLPQLAGTVNRFRHALRFALQLLGLTFALIALAQPRWGYTFQDVKRKGLDLLIAVDTSRSMLSNDVQPNRLERVKLAAQDLINELQGDRVGLIAFAGRAFLQAPLTIDYGAVVESINDLDTKTVPEGGTNISEAIALASRTFGKSAMGNRALIIFTDGEELSGDAVKSAKAATDAGVRIFTVGVGTPQGSLIPISGEDGETAFVKDSAGQVVKSKLDEKRLREVAQASGGFYLQLENGPRTMQQIYSEGLAKMQAAEFDVRLSRRPIERYEWPLGAALIALALSILIGERKRVRAPVRSHALLKLAPTAAALLLLSFQNAPAAPASAPGLQLYRDGKYAEAYRSFQEDLKNHPDSAVKDKMQFDSGTAAYKMGDYDKAVEAFSEALLSREKGLQENSHFNAGRTLEERADMDKSDEDALTDLKNAQTHYEDALKLNPNNQAAKANLEAVKKKIERLKKHPKEKRPPPPQQQKDKKKEDSNQGQNGSNQQQQNQQQSRKDQQQQQSQSQNQQQQKDQQQQSQDRQSQKQSSSGQDQQNKNDQSQAKNQPQQSKQQNDRPKPGESPSPSPGEQQKQSSSSPSPDEKKQNQQQPGNEGERPSPTPGKGGNETPSPSPGSDAGSGENATPSATPAGSPQKKFVGEVKGANKDKSQKPPPEKTAQVAEAEAEKEGQMSERQAEALLQSMKDEEARVRLDEHRATRHVYNDW
jgi:Ca-activated chloride channel homolog